MPCSMMALTAAPLKKQSPRLLPKAGAIIATSLFGPCRCWWPSWARQRTLAAAMKGWTSCGHRQAKSSPSFTSSHCEHNDSGEKSGYVSNTEDGLFLEMPEGRLKLSIMRVAILGKLAEFLLACNEFSYSGEVMETLSQIAREGMETPAAIKDGGRALWPG